MRHWILALALGAAGAAEPIRLPKPPRPEASRQNVSTRTEARRTLFRERALPARERMSKARERIQSSPGSAPAPAAQQDAQPAADAGRR